MEKRSEDDKPSSALSSEIKPGSERCCCDWSLSGGSDSETHETYEPICVKNRVCLGLLCVVFPVPQFRA